MDKIGTCQGLGRFSMLFRIKLFTFSAFCFVFLSWNSVILIRCKSQSIIMFQLTNFFFSNLVISLLLNKIRELSYFFCSRNVYVCNSQMSLAIIGQHNQQQCVHAKFQRLKINKSIELPRSWTRVVPIRDQVVFLCYLE